MGGFAGSFSNASCNGTMQATLALPGFGGGFGKPVRDTNCERVIRSQAFSVEAQRLSDNGNAAKAAAMGTMAVYELCVASPDTQSACEDLGLVVKRSKK